VVRTADTVADERADDGKLRRFDDDLDGVRDVADVVPDAGLLDARVARVLADLEQPPRLVGDLTDPERVCAVRDQSVEVIPTSTEIRSPSSTRCEPGIPWTTIEFGEMHVAAGKPR